MSSNLFKGKFTNKLFPYGELVNIVENGHGDQSSNYGRGCLRFTYCEYLWESYESQNSSSTYG